MFDYDIIVIGGGPAGYVAASYGTQYGKRIALIEKEKLGGCCLNVGCIPTKALLNVAGNFKNVSSSTNYGITADNVKFSWEQFKDYSEGIRDRLRKGIQNLLKSREITVLNGEAVLKDNHSVNVENKIITAEYIIIATGSKPSIPEKFEKIDNLLTSDTFWEISHLPKSVVIVGGGVIGCEIASALSRLGSKVVIVEQLGKILPQISVQAGNILCKQLLNDNVDILCNSSVKDIRKENDELIVEIGETSIKSEYVLWATGRSPVILNIGKLKLKRDNRNFFKVNSNYQTEIENIYCIGDANGQNMLAYTAIDQAISIIKHICTGKTCYSPQIPQCIFTFPAISKIGLSEEKCIESNIPVSIGTIPFSAIGYSHVLSATDGYIKIIRDIETDCLLGAEIVGCEAVELIHILQPFVERKIPLRAFADIIPAHPTLCEGIKMAIENSYIKSPHL